MSSTQRIVQIPLVVQAEIPFGMSDAEILERIRFFLSAPMESQGLAPHEVLNVRFTNVKEAPIQPGDLVEHRTRDLDPREVIATGRDWIALDFGREDDVYTRLPRDNYRVDVRAEGVL